MNDENILLASLEARGKEFLTLFADFETEKERIKDRESISTAPEFNGSTGTVDDSEPDEWTGFASDSDLDMGTTETSKTGLYADSETHTPEVVVFCEGSSRTIAKSKAQGRSFMSSKVSKLKESPKVASDTQIDAGDIESEISNTRNDTLLHQLVHTQLLSGSLNPELNMTPAQRRKALSGRVLELAGDSKLGKGEGAVREDERKKASKRVRDGMMAKRKERDINALNEAKNAGNYHPALKRLFSASSGTQPRKRDRGLKMGVGRFSGGMLKLTPEEIGRVQDRNTRGRGSSGKRRR